MDELNLTGFSFGDTRFVKGFPSRNHKVDCIKRGRRLWLKNLVLSLLSTIFSEAAVVIINGDLNESVAFKKCLPNITSFAGKFHRPPQMTTTPLTGTERKSDNYYFVTTSERQEMERLTFSELLKRERGSYETVTETEGGGQPQNLCLRCRQPIGDRPFCYNCYGPKKREFKWLADNYKWILTGACLAVAISLCFLICLMHMYNFGIYRDEHVVILEGEIRTTKSLLRFTTAYTDGFISQISRNMTLLLKNLNQVKKQLSNEEKYYKDTKEILRKIKQLLLAGCDEYLLKTSTTKVGKACSLLVNGTHLN